MNRKTPFLEKRDGFFLFAAEFRPSVTSFLVGSGQDNAAPRGVYKGTQRAFEEKNWVREIHRLK
jgi:hypothetical protein